MSTRIVKGLAFALILYVGLTSILGFREFGESLGQISLGIWLLGPSICLFSHIVLEGRWQFYLKSLGFPLPFKPAAKIYAAGLALMAAPGRSGEAIRGLWLKRRHGFPLTVGVGITLAERLADLASALLVMSWGLGETTWAAMLIGLAVLGTGGWLFTHPRVLRRLEHWLETLPLHERWNGLLRLLREALLAMGRMRELMKPWPLIVGTLMACLCWMSEAWLLMIIYGALGVEMDIHHTAVVRTATGLGGVISFLPAGLGTSEITSIGLAMLYGAERSQALAGTLVLRICTLAIPCMIGLFALLRQPDLGKSSKVGSS